MPVKLRAYPDELIISMIGRYRLHSAKLGFKEALRDIFGIDSARPSLHLPSHLQRMSEQGHFGVSAEDLVYKHTLFPYYAPFLKADMAARIMRDMLSDQSLGVHLESGLVASRVSLSKRMAVCPLCILEDVETYGEPYWHRSHHLPGVLSCAKHRVTLYDRCPTCNIPFVGAAIQEIPFPVVACPQGHTLLNAMVEGNSYLDKIAIDSNFILHNTVPWKSLDELRERYVNILSAKGMATPSGYIRQRELFERFIRFFPSHIWGRIHVEPPVPDLQWDWLRELVRKPKKALHPLFHILLMEFLSEDVSRFYSQAHFEPFGCGPWPCLNKVAAHYMQNVVRELTVTLCSDTKRPVGTFRCDCGFVYSRRGPDKTKEDRTRYGRIKEFGYVWEERLRSLVSDGALSLRGLARELGTDPKTITARFAKQLPSDTCINVAKATEHDVRKKRFLETLRANAQCNRSELKRLNYRDYHWLYRHEPEWLDSVLPHPLSSGVRPVNRVDWARRDRELSALVERIAESIRNSLGKPVWVTVGRIGRVCGKKALLEKCLDKLPLTQQVLNKVVESRNEFHKRRVDWAVAELLLVQFDIAEWQVIRKAGLRTPVSEELSEYTEQHLKMAVEQRDDSKGVDEAPVRIS